MVFGKILQGVISFFKGIAPAIKEAWKAADIYGKAGMVFTGATVAVGVKGFLEMREMLSAGQSIMANKTAAGGKIPVIYGTRRVGTQIVYMDTFGNENRDLYVVYALAVGECEEILGRTIEIDGNSILDAKIFKKGGYIGSDKISSGAGSLCTADQGGDVNAGVGGGIGTDPTKRYQFVFNLHHGADSQTADPMLRASIPNAWSTNHKLNGICYIAAHFHYSKTGVFQGVPQITVQVKGKKVYDPRESGHTFGDPSTYEWSSNPALCYLDYITNDSYGKGLAESDINMSTFETAATKCDVEVDQPYYNGAYQSVTWSGTSGDDFIVINDNDEWYQNKTDEVFDLRDNGGSSIFTGSGRITGVQRHQFYDDDLVNKIFINETLTSTYTNEAGSARAKVKRFHCNGYIDTNKSVMDNSKELLANMRGIFSYINGKYELQIEDTGSSTFSITEDHIIGSSGLSIDYGNKDKKANKVVIEFYNSQLDYELDTATVLHDATPEYYSDDGEILEVKAQFPLITDAYIAYNMGKAILTRSRNQMSIRFLGTPEMYKLNVGDIVDITYAGLDLSTKICRVEALELQSNGLVGVSLIEYFDVYTWEVPAQEDARKLLKIPTRGAIHPPEASSIVFTDTDASPINRPTLTWTEPTDFDVKEFRVDVVDSSDNNVFSKRVNTPSVDLSFLPKAANYEASITSFNTFNVESEPVTKTFTIADSPTRTDDIQNSAITDAKVADISADKIDTGVLNLGTESGMAVRQAKTGYTDTTTGFWLGNDSGTPKFNIGTSSSYFKFDGSSVEVSGELSATTGSIGGFDIGTNDLTAGTGATRISLSTTNGIHLGSNTFSAAPFRVALDGSLTATNANVTGDLETGNLIVTGSAGIHGEVRATSLTAGTVTVASINQEVWNEIDARTAPTQNGFYDSYDSTSTGTYYNGVDTDFELLGSGGNGYLSNGQDVSIRTSMIHGYAQTGSQTYTGDALKATFQFQYKALPSGSWTDFGSSQVYTTDAYSTPDGFFYELDADPSATVSLSSGIYYQFRLNVTPTVTNNVWADSDANDVFAVAFAIQQSSTGTGAGTGTVTSIDAGDGLQTSTGSAITSSGSLLVDSTVVRTSGTQTIAGNKTFSNNVVIEGDLTVQGTTTTIDTTNLDVKDKNITLNYGTGDTSANADGAGITIQDAVNSTTDATILWATANDTFNFSHPVSVTGNITSSNTVTSQSINVNSSGYGTIEVGGVSGAYIDLKRPNTDDFDLRLITDGTGGVIDTGSGELTLKRQGSTKIATTSSGIDVTGNISIGTDSGDPFNSNAKIKIQDSGTAYIQIKTGTSNSGGLLVGDTADDFVGGFIYNNSTNHLSLYSNDNISLELDDNYDVNVYQGALKIGGTEVITSSANLTNIGTIDSGAITSTGTSSFGVLNSSGNIRAGNGSTTGNVQFTSSSYQISGGSGVGDLRFVAPRFRFYEDNTSGTADFQIDGGNATFTGTISSGAITSTGQFSVNTGATGTLAQFRGADTDLLNIDGDSNAITLDARNVGAFNIEMQGTNALTIDNSQNASFAGTVTADGLTVDGLAEISAQTNGAYALRVGDAAGSSGSVAGIGKIGINPQGAGTFTYTGTEIRATENALGDYRARLSFHTRGSTSDVEPLERLRIEQTGDISFYDNTGTTQGLFWDASAESLGIGTENPSSRLDIVHTNNSPLRLQNTTGVIVKTKFEDNASRQAEIALNTGSITFSNGTSSVAERMRISAAGNVLIGKTSADDFSSAGVQIEPAGQITTSIASDSALRLNRGGTDGTIIELNKAGATVGSIGTNSGNAYISGETRGLHFTGTAGIIPCNEAGAARDADTDLGKSDTRFKDLYLSGTLTNDGSGGISIDTLGNVGIGTVPQAFNSSYQALEIENLNLMSRQATDSYITSNSAYLSGGWTTKITGEAAQYYQAGATHVWRTSASTSAGATTSWSERMRIDDAGNVGIGTSSPSGKLDVAGVTPTLTISDTQDKSWTSSDTTLGELAFRTRDSSGIGSHNVSFIRAVNEVASSTTPSGALSFGISQANNNASEAMRISADGKVGIGTSSPNQMLELSANNGAGAINVLRFNDSDTAVAGGQTTGRIEFAENDGANTTVSAFLEVETVATAGGGIMTFGTGTAGVTASEKMRIDSSGNVGIGTTNPSSLDVNGNRLVVGGGSGNEGMTIFSGTTGLGTILFADGNDGSNAEYRGWMQYEHTNDSLEFATASAERMRIDSSGNLLVGKTSSGLANAGIEATASNILRTTKANSASAEFNRTGSDGDIAIFWKDTSIVGSIGAKGTDLYIGTGDVGLAFYDYSTENAILPHNPATNAFADASIDLGRGTSGSAYRFKNLYLSGDINADGDISTSGELQVDSIANIDGALTSGTITALGTVKAVRTDTLTQWGIFGQDSSGGYITQHRNNASLYENFRFLASNTSGTVERARIDTTGNLLVGTTSETSWETAKGFRTRQSGSTTITRDGNPPLYINRLTSDGVVMVLKRGTTNSGQIGILDSVASSTVYFASGSSSSTGTGLKFVSAASTNNILPCRGDGTSVDNLIDLGSSGTRFDDIYATNGTIQTSDRNEKQDIQELSEAEQRVAVACKGLIRRYKFNSAVAEKGDDARYHFGIIAQDLQDAFTAEGLDAGDYGMFISETWTDEEGNEQTKLGVRYNELLAFIIATL